MNILELIPLVLSFALSLCAVWFVMQPYFAGVPAGAAEDERGGDEDDLALRRETLMQALEDLELDYRSGKMDEQLYQDSRRELVAQAAAVYQRIGSAEGRKNAAV